MQGDCHETPPPEFFLGPLHSVIFVRQMNDEARGCSSVEVSIKDGIFDVPPEVPSRNSIPNSVVIAV